MHLAFAHLRWHSLWRLGCPLTLTALLALQPDSLNAQLTSPPQEPVIGARMPALSPDGRRLAFVYRGDVWVSDAEGGRATPVTQNLESDAFPLFSPDGQWVAFSSKRNGNWDIFAVPVQGGAPKQLTWNSGAEIA